ncbi:EscU/YscU/HrcU family type III secretion system export apparatus switch protein [Cryobacterium levicorallinum]|uniref:EscU/YscU/HrcU family type III secretion system export apparatus switch protein n=1 Tax=Cryobacterium levicorallinum TaxID=995038 RepID=A0A1I3BQS8_9MICO|nr:EscU/YscU/HrcU family type III secretion system export apparatus switch protein [Cryobacterium levicorallinum]TFB83103.1 EscU/YscU/HrcU family type III secretion system export apparatus switch protein [Cryobacterium levicorallinum]GEP25415.1 flagellar biosynthesis protein FlhB [Cryobacterium levicorallinum]SFH64632.1 flagellar biosynthetic protein FlhB [Cryobacterium levicorallinum]
MAEDSGEKTELATPKRMKEVREKGQLSKSQDITAWLGVGAAALMLPTTIERGAAAGTDQMFMIGTLTASPDTDVAVEALGNGLVSMAEVLTPFFVVVLVVVLGGAALQGGIHFKKFTGKYEQFNVITGMKRVFGGQALWEGVKVLAKTAVVGFVLYMVIQGLMPVLMTAGGLPVSELMIAATGGAAALLQAAVVAGLVLAAADVFVVMRRNRKKTRMSKKEVKDENKAAEGDPLIKSQRRSRQIMMSRNRMISAVADADVVLVNPTHVAVALKYEPGRSAPRVIAKGLGHVAARIREQADTDRVPIVQDIPLARALHAACEIGEEIPADMYNAVARVLAFVMALKARGSTGAGVHTMSSPFGGARPMPSSQTQTTQTTQTTQNQTTQNQTTQNQTAGGR